MRRAAIPLAFLAVTLFAQERQPDPFFSETIEVRIINVDAIVTDGSGKPVRGLTRDDFEVFENGHRQDISNFAEMAGTSTTVLATADAAPRIEAAPSQPQQDVRSRKIVIFLDNASLRIFTRNKVFESMKTFVRQTVRPGDQVMIVAWNPPLDIGVPFTGDVEALIATIEAMKNERANGNLYLQDRKMAERAISDMPTDYAMIGQIPPIELAIEQARLYAAKVMHEQRGKVAAMKSVMSSLRGIEGRKVFVVVTESLSDRAAQPIFDFVDQVKERFVNGVNYNAVREAQQYAEPALTNIMSDTANSTGVTFYPIDAAGLSGDMEAISAENLGTEYNNPGRQLMHRDEHLQTLRTIAALTGGTALTSSSNFQLAFDTISNDLSSYYSIGYRATGAKQDTIRSVQVRLKNKRGLQVRTRQAFVERSTSSEMKDAVAANLFYPINRNDLNIRIRGGGATKVAIDEHLVVPVEVRIPTSALTLLPDGGDLRGRFQSYTAFLRRDGAVSEVKMNVHELRFPAGSLERRKEITLELEVTVDSKTEAVSVGVMDEVSHATGFASLRLEQPGV
ncbi:MAG TPA: VWA domain-containing protein [Thermoanaerobaculia bacterium]|jgi:VWFA-related protein|nr:VWA domain-containing protein [Thermoanaerobaculia bacterium]